MSFMYLFQIRILCLTILLPCAAFSQGIHYKDPIFKQVSVNSNLTYAERTPDRKARDVLFDLYQPKDDSTSARPLVIWIHGGGFKFGHKKSRGTPRWSRMFAERGYVCAAVNYRKSKKKPLKKFEDLADGCLMAVEDVEVAMQYFRRHADSLHIDPNKIILAGNSAGGMVALQAAFANRAELAAIAARSNDKNLNPAPNPQRVFAVINFWGAVFDTAWLKKSSLPIVSAHGNKDRVVAYYQKGLPVYGSGIVHRVAGKQGIPNALYTFNGMAHELQKHFIPFYAGGPAKKRWKQAAVFAINFLHPFVTGQR